MRKHRPLHRVGGAAPPLFDLETALTVRDAQSEAPLAWKRFGEYMLQACIASRAPLRWHRRRKSGPRVLTGEEN